jgi:tetratricopeptide (TPR) repeat protein
MEYMRRSFRANELSLELLRKSPDLPHYQALHAAIHTALAMRQMRIGNFESAERIWNEVLVVYNSLIRSSPDVILYERRYCDVLESLAELKVREGDYKAAQQYLERAIKRLQLAMRRSPNSPIVRMQMRRLTQQLRRHAESQKTQEPENSPKD